MASKLSDECDSLYTDLLKNARQSRQGVRKLFSQVDIANSTNMKKSPAELSSLLTELVNQFLLRTSKNGGRLCWIIRARDVAKSLKGLTGDQQTVYACIEETQEKGIWSRDLKQRTNVNDQVCKKALEKLESMRLIKSIKNVKSPLQKTYIAYHLIPDDDITGGSFFDDGEVDGSLVDEISNLIVFHVRGLSWAKTDRKRGVKREASPSSDAEDVKKKKRKNLDGQPAVDIEDSGPARKRRSIRPDPETDATTAVAFPARYNRYPTTQSIHEFITTTEVLRDAKANSTTVTEIQGVIDVLVWDDKLERVGDGYRTVKGVRCRLPGYPLDKDGEEEDRRGGKIGNSVTQTPCGGCPVFELCKEDGPVNADSCVYLDQWIGIEHYGKEQDGLASLEQFLGPGTDGTYGSI